MGHNAAKGVFGDLKDDELNDAIGKEGLYFRFMNSFIDSFKNKMHETASDMFAHNAGAAPDERI